MCAASSAVLMSVVDTDVQQTAECSIQSTRVHTRVLYRIIKESVLHYASGLVLHNSTPPAVVIAASGRPGTLPSQAGFWARGSLASGRGWPPSARRVPAACFQTSVLSLSIAGMQPAAGRSHQRQVALGAENSMFVDRLRHGVMCMHACGQRPWLTGALQKGTPDGGGTHCALRIVALPCTAKLGSVNQPACIWWLHACG